MLRICSLWHYLLILRSRKPPWNSMRNFESRMASLCLILHYIGDLLGACISAMTRPDIPHAVQIVIQFVNDPHKSHLTTVHHILCHTLGTLDWGLFYPSTSSLSLSAYLDADWASCPDTRRSSIGRCIFLRTSLIFWMSKKQTTVSKSFAEVEYRLCLLQVAKCFGIDDLFGNLVSFLLVLLHSMQIT